MDSQRISKLNVETVYFGAPGAEVRKTSELVKISVGHELELSSKKFGVRHRMKIVQISSDFIEIQPADEKSASVVTHLKKKNDPRGYSISEKPPKGLWKQELRVGEVLILVEPGINDAGVQWELSIPQ